MPGARIRDVAKGLPRLVWPSDYYPFLHFHVGTNVTARGNLEYFTSDYRTLGVRVKGVGTQVVFSSILPVRRKGSGRSGLIQWVKTWLCGWCHRQGFGSYGHETLFEERGLLSKDGIHLTKWGKSVFANRLANQVRRALK